MSTGCHENACGRRDDSKATLVINKCFDPEMFRIWGGILSRSEVIWYKVVGGDESQKLETT